MQLIAIKIDEHYSLHTVGAQGKFGDWDFVHCPSAFLASKQSCFNLGYAAPAGMGIQP